jgi:hypothetical protein
VVKEADKIYQRSTNFQKAVLAMYLPGTHEKKKMEKEGGGCLAILYFLLKYFIKILTVKTSFNEYQF